MPRPKHKDVEKCPRLVLGVLSSPSTSRPSQRLRCARPTVLCLEDGVHRLKKEIKGRESRGHG